MQQQEIGVNLMIRCFLSKGWMAAIEAAGALHPKRRINMLQRMTCDTIMEPLWQERNDIKTSER